MFWDETSINVYCGSYVSRRITRDRYEKLQRYLHCIEAPETDPKDRLRKVFIIITILFSSIYLKLCSYKKYSQLYRYLQYFRLVCHQYKYSTIEI